MNYQLISKSLMVNLSLRQEPVAISFSDTVPSDIPAYQGRVAAGCRFWEEAATRTFATSATDHSLCAIGVYTHNLEPSANHQTDLHDALNVFDQLGYVTNADLPGIPTLKSRPGYVIYSPLSDVKSTPQVVLLFVDASQTLILTEATSQVEHEHPPAMGRPACAVVPQVINTGRASLSLGCCGARAYLDTLDAGTAIFAIPAEKLDLYSSRIESLAKANTILSKFHQLRRQDVEAGKAPTIKESLALMAAQ
jgi:uncharacterized protein (DUF169 family)